MQLLSEQDEEQLRELARLVFIVEVSADVEDLAQQVKTRESASPLAIVIADIVLESSFPVRRKQSMLGAIFGAYAALTSGSIEHACMGGIAGAISISVPMSIPIDVIPLGP
jgi:hypothetical protein